MTENMTKEMALEILGLQSDATREEIERKYENFMRQSKYDDAIDVDVITRAHDFLLGYEWGEFKKDPAYTEKGINRKKISNFFYHYKLKLLGGAALFLLLGIVLVTWIGGRERHDLGVAFVGDLMINDTQGMRNHLSETYGFDKLGVTYASYVLDQGEVSVAIMMRLMGIITDPTYHVLFMNREAAEFLSGEVAIEDLTGHLAVLGIGPEDDRLLTIVNDQFETVIAAIYIGEDVRMREHVDGSVPTYVGMTRKNNDPEKALQLILAVLEQSQ